MGKLNVWFSEVIKEFCDYFREKKSGRPKMQESKVAMLFQSLSIDITKSYG